MKYVFLISYNSGHEDRIGFFADDEPSARREAEEWIGSDGTVEECVEVWSIQNN